MIDFQEKAAVFFDPTWLLIFLAVCISGWIQFSIVREYDSNHSYPESLALLLVQMTVATTFLGMSPVVHGAVMSLWIVLGLTYFLWRKQPTTRIQTHYGTVSYSIVIIFVLGVCCISFTSTQVHYDYFHGTVASIDLAIHGNSPSKWLSRFDATYWPIITQTLLPTFDAFEIYYANGVLTNTLSFLFLIFLAMAVLTRLNADIVTQIIITALLAIYIYNFALTPRSHIFVGLAYALLLLCKNKQWIAAVTAISIGIFAKRDGIIILSILTSLLFIYYQSKFFIRNSGKTKQFILFFVYATLFLLFSYLSSKWVVIRGLTLAEISSLALNTKGFSLVLKIEIIISLLLLFAVLYSFAQSIKEKESPIPEMIVLSVCTHTIISGWVLESLGQYNEGTVTRKLAYMLIPVAVIFFASKVRVIQNADT